MKFLTRSGALFFLLCAATAAVAAPASAAFTVPVEYHKLDNGLRVVLSRDTTAPKTVVAVYYGIGFRIEPQNRTGFAHLFEHMMFQGSSNLGKTEAPAEKELRGIQNYLAGLFVLRNSNRPGIIAQLQLMDLHGLPEDYLTTWVKKVYAVKPGDVQRVASKYIADDQATIVVAGDQKIIAEQLAPFGKK